MAKIRPITVDRKPSGRDGKLGGLLNLGPKSSAWLAEAGIHTRDQLVQIGPIGACRRLIERGHSVSVLLAYAIEGGLTGTHWNALPFETKSWLRKEFARMKRAGLSAAALAKAGRRGGNRRPPSVGTPAV